MSITASQVKDLRERTGAGMMECKKALVETGGDIDAAVEHLRKSGLAKADKKAGRVAAEGAIVDAGKISSPRTSTLSNSANGSASWPLHRIHSSWTIYRMPNLPKARPLKLAASSWLPSWVKISRSGA